MAKATLLTLASAKDYVRGYYESQEDVSGVDIIGCGLCKVDGADVCKLNVVIEPSGDLIQWDVWAEDDGMGGETLYGEF
jgi:hypothetical protein